MNIQTIQQLASARSLALGDGRYYPTIIPGVLPIIGYTRKQSIDVLRWGADFLAEAFASPTWTPEGKESCAILTLATLKGYLENADDTSVIKSAVQTAASVYPLVYKHIITDSTDSQNWQLMAGIKSNILRRMDNAAPGVRICCVKFLQQVVLTQTLGVLDPRRPDPNDISLAIAPRNHPLVPYASLEAEGSGLLDRLLDIIHGDHGDGLLITGTLNSVGMLIHRRPNIASKILNSVFNFNPLKLANSSMTPKDKVIIKSIERTTRALLMNVMKRGTEPTLQGQIQHFLKRMHQNYMEIFDESRKKRPAPVEPTDGLDQAKRQRISAEPSSNTPPIPALPAGPVSWRQLYTLNPEGSTVNFDVQNFQDPEQLLRILVPVLQSVDGKKLEQAINIVKLRYAAFLQTAPRTAVPQAIVSTPEDEEEYEPDFEPEDAEQIENKIDGIPPTDFPIHTKPKAGLASFKLPDAPSLSSQEVQRYGSMTVRRAFSMLEGSEDIDKNKVTKGGFNRLAATDYSRDAWVTILSRLATRANTGLADPEDDIKDEHAVKSADGNTKLADAVRDGLYQYIMYDWKRRIDIAISWLNEEWYNDIIVAQFSKGSTSNWTVDNHSRSYPPNGNYQRCALRLIDGILPYVEHTDKILLRFLSEVPALDYEFLIRLKKMAEDPERIDLACNGLHYLYMFRPPVRNIVVDVLSQMWQENERAKPSARKLLIRWRPEILGETTNLPLMKSEGDTKLAKESANGILEIKAAS